MSLRTDFFYFALIVILFTVSGCGLRIGEKSSYSNIEGFSIGCLNGINEKVDLYLKGRLDDNQINQVSNCIKTALIIFKNRVHGRRKGEFTPNELRKFIQDLFLQDRVVNDNLLVQLVRLKQVMIGGPADKLTISDIERFILFVDMLKKEAIFFQPYIQILNTPSREQPLRNQSHLDAIEQQFKESIGRVSVFLKQFSNPYHLSDITALVRELDFFFDNQYNVPHLDEKIKLVGVLKQFMVGGSDSVIFPDEWEQILSGYSYLISISMNYIFFKRQETLISSKGMHYIAIIFTDLLDFLSLSLKNRLNGLIAESDFLKVISHIQSAQIIPMKLTEKSIRNLLLIIFGKIFNVQKERYGVIELTPAQLKKMYDTIAIWHGIQSFLDSVSDSQSLYESFSDPLKMKPFFLSQEVFSKGQDIINQILLLKPLYRTGKKIHLSRQLYFGEDSQKPSDYKNLTLYNFYHFISRIIRMGYEKDYPNSAGIVQEELENFFFDFNVIGENIGWFQKTEERALTEGESQFIAANMLTSTAKGFNHDWSTPEYLTSNEITEYLVYAVSFSISFQEVKSTFIKLCIEGGNGYHSEESDQEEEKYHVDCVRVHLLSVLKKYMNNMPDLQKILGEMDEEAKKQLTDALIHVAFETEEEYKRAVYIAHSHLKNIIIALYFVETTMNRYDVDGDFVLNHDEIIKAYPVFKGYLSRVLIYLLCRPTDRSAASMYAYVIKKLKLPTNNMKWHNLLWAFLQLETHTHLYHDGEGLHLWDLHLNRAKLTTVFSTIIKGLLDKKEERKSEQCEIEKDMVETEPRSFFESSRFPSLFPQLPYLVFFPNIFKP